MATGEPSEVTLSRAIVSCGYSFEKHLELKKVAPLLYENKTIPKQTRRLIKASEKASSATLFKQALLGLDPEGFAQFLLALETVGDENHRKLLSALATELRDVGILKKTQTSPATQSPGLQEAIETIRRIQRTYFEKSKHVGLPEEHQQSLGEVHTWKASQVEESIQQHNTSESLAVTSHSPHTQELQSNELQSYTETESEADDIKVETQRFLRTSGGTFYSSAHGVTVTIPEQAFSDTVSEFDLSMTASMHSSLPIDRQCYTPCSAFISLKCDPPFEEFADYVTVEIPHSVTDVDAIQEHLCVLSAPDTHPAAESDGAMFQEDPDIEVDFSNRKYVTFRTKHFSTYSVVVSKGKRKQRSFCTRSKKYLEMLKRKTKSLDRTSPPTSPPAVSSLARSQSNPVQSSRAPADHIESCIAMFTPKLRAEHHLWKVVFLVAPVSVPTAWVELEQSALELLDLPNRESLAPSDPQPFTFDQPSITFVPASFCDKGWEVAATKRPPVISRSGVEEFFTQSEEQRKAAKLIPHCQQYSVERVGEVAGTLKMVISVERAYCFGEKVAFTLSGAPSCPTSAGEVEVPSITDLYSEDCPIRQALGGAIDPGSVSLTLDSRDAISFLAELSFHLRTKWKDLAVLLRIEQPDIDNIAAALGHQPHGFEASFQMLKVWIEQNTPNASLTSLLRALKRTGIVVRQRSWRRPPHSPPREDQGYEFELRTQLPRQIASQWRFVARFMGIREYDIDNISESGRSPSSEALVDQAREMLHISMTVCLPKSLLRDAIHAIYDHTYSSYLRDAYWFISS